MTEVIDHSTHLKSLAEQQVALSNEIEKKRNLLMKVTGANYALRFYNDNGLVGSVLVNGSGVTYNTSSDYRLKENQVSISDAISKVKQLKPYTFNFKVTPDQKVDGFFAHEAQEVVSYAVLGEKDAEDMQQMDYGKLTPLLTAALQEAITEIESLKAEVAALKSS